MTGWSDKVECESCNWVGKASEADQLDGLSSRSGVLFLVDLVCPTCGDNVIEKTATDETQ
jgi:predicted RNA-binding Zn-ribbon protein involved in translation (DUF1610 family)